MKILFINPSIREEDNPKHVPYGEALVAACSEKWFNAQVALLDLNILRSVLKPEQLDEELRTSLEADDWDIVATGGITTAYSSVKRTLEIAKPLCPDSLFVAGGGLVTSQPLEMMHWLPQIDVGVLGEGEYTIGEVIEHCHDRDFAKTQGVVYRDRDRKPRLNKERPVMPDLDVLPYPAWDLIHTDLYFRNSSLLLSEEAMLAKRRLDIAASRGCSFACKFCYHLGVIGDLKTHYRPDGQLDVGFDNLGVSRTLRWHSVEYIVDMVKYAKSKWDIDFVDFLDENLVAMHWASPNRDWLFRLSEAWVDAGLQPKCVRQGVEHDPEKCREGIHVGGAAHAGLIQPEILKAMKRMGFTYVTYGLESFDDRLLKEMGKAATGALNERAVKITMDHGIRPIPNQIIGFPDEDFESIRTNMRMWQKLGVVVSPFLCTPYPGSQYYYEYKDKILDQYDGDLESFVADLGDATKPTAIISKNFNAIELVGLREAMVNFNWRLIDKYEEIWRRNHGLPPRQHTISPEPPSK